MASETRLGSMCIVFSMPSHPTAFRLLCTAGFLTRGSGQPFAFPAQGQWRMKGARRLQSRGRLRQGRRLGPPFPVPD
ncbi:MAG: hypothetical protein ACD_54C00699G0003 [uncultured bacterium]|nr:MAG: hypothetical protein ACD_54C00699G0003 [uncultured bacterium]